MKKIAILGSTGSIGTQTLAVVAANRDKFQVMTLAANTNDQLLEQQIKEFEPELAVLVDLEAAKRLQKRFVGKTKILAGQEGLLEAATYEVVETVVTSMVGFAGLEPTIAAIEAGKDIALANKETLVVAGELVMKLAKEKGVSILPVDSEHCAIFQCLQGEDRRQVHKILLTASGGPFRGKTRKELAAVSIKDCLNHPTWSMGKKISIDSASLVNKGLEVIEAKWLYGVDYNQIKVVVHPQSIVHSMVEYIDGTVMAQLGSTDMRLPIQYALTYPQRIDATFPKLDFWNCKDLTFSKPDMDTFLGLKMAYEAGRIGGTMPCAFNAANEIAVDAFLKESISFLQIYDIIEKTMTAHHVKMNPTLQDLYENDSWARSYAADLFSK
ncbi:1-deoxy-D-xylulose-5-phosphate reductoisomerase [Propionispira raffinosivorans]|uniref:1-deoxy-D-xylulose-5-phosphate reductoisomerase n=1 Tax=Propionispira raffinosivorans TaxID=86959 RepID=UPI00037D8DD9|nr:1-deoxy-D-xylulose-5-phosphate reductoisomerase [Propionispira raffinosivorans]